MKYNACLSPNTTKLLTRTTIHRYVIKETSELTYPESVSRRVVCIEEIYHPFTIELDIGGRRYISYGYDKDDRKEKRVQEILDILPEYTLSTLVVKFFHRFTFLTVIIFIYQQLTN